MSLLLKKPVKTGKAKINLIFITIPTVIFFLYKHFMQGTLEGDKPLVHPLVLFMVVSRCMRALNRILKVMRGEKSKKRLTKLAPIVLTKNQSAVIGQRLTAAVHPENPESEESTVRRRLLAPAHTS